MRYCKNTYSAQFSATSMFNKLTLQYIKLNWTMNLLHKKRHSPFHIIISGNTFSKINTKRLNTFIYPFEKKQYTVIHRERKNKLDLLKYITQ